jgi:4-hydroxy-tetrahydrodipicolinate synthase
LGGSTGEGALLNDQELARGIQIVQDENRERVPVLCGIIRNSTRQAVSAGLAAKAAGADVLMVTPTYYHGTSTEGNCEYFETIAKKVGLPIIIYNVIKTNPISPAAMMKISEVDLIIGIKQSVSGIHGLTDMIATCGSKSLVFGAQDDLMYISYLLGAVGSISAILTAFPDLCVEQWNAVKAGNIELAKEIHYRILPIWRKIEGGAFPGKIKAVLKLLGRNVGKARSPILEPTPAELLELRTELTNAGFLNS